MKLGSTRPDIEDIGFELYDRSIHPEFFDVVNRREFAIHPFQMRIVAWLTRDGHMIEYRHANFRLVEILGSLADERPVTGLNRKVKLRHHHQFDNPVAGQAICRFGLQREILDPHIFERMQQEIARDARKSKLRFVFPASTRVDSSAVSYVTVNTLPGALAVQTFHTYPDDAGIVKTQTLLELDPAHPWS